MADVLSELTIRPSGGSGIEICAKAPESFNCVEFHMRTDAPVAVFISPWLQFEPSAMQDWRLGLAYEIARRAMAHTELLKKVELLEKTLEAERKVMDRRQERQFKSWEMWAEERERYGLPKDFSDIKHWPPEMMGGYDHQQNAAQGGGDA